MSELDTQWQEARDYDHKCTPLAKLSDDLQNEVEEKMIGPEPDPQWEEDRIMAGEKLDRDEIYNEMYGDNNDDDDDRMAEIADLHRIINKQHMRIIQLEEIKNKAEDFLNKWEIFWESWRNQHAK